MIGVVGAGISGLVLAHELARRGREVRVWEARRRPGGVIRSEEVDGLTVDLGPQRTRLTAAVRELVERVGLTGEVLEAPPDLPLYVYRDGRLRQVPFTPAEAVRTDLLSWRGKLRCLLEPLAVPHRAGETVEEFFVRSFGREAYENLLGPLYGGLYASDPASMPARHALRPALERLGAGTSLLWTFLRRGRGARSAVPTVTFVEGMAALPHALGASLGERLRTLEPVRRIERGPARRLRVVSEGEELEVRSVVLACAADAASRILESVDPAAAGRLASLRYNPLGVVHLRGACELRGYGYQVAFGEELWTRGVTWNASIFGRDGLYTAYLGGMGREEILERSNDRLAAVAAEEFREVTGCEAEPIHVHRTRMPAWDRSWDALDGLALPDGVHLCSNYTGRPGIPGRVRAANSLAGELSRRR